MKFRRSSVDSGGSQIPEDAVFLPPGGSTRVRLTLRRDTPPTPTDGGEDGKAGERARSPDRGGKKAEERTRSPSRGGKTGGGGQRRPRRPGGQRNGHGHGRGHRGSATSRNGRASRDGRSPRNGGAGLRNSGTSGSGTSLEDGGGGSAASTWGASTLPTVTTAASRDADGARAAGTADDIIQPRDRSARDGGRRGRTGRRRGDGDARQQEPRRAEVIIDGIPEEFLRSAERSREGDGDEEEEKDASTTPASTPRTVHPSIIKPVAESKWQETKDPADLSTSSREGQNRGSSVLTDVMDRTQATRELSEMGSAIEALLRRVGNLKTVSPVESFNLGSGDGVGTSPGAVTVEGAGTADGETAGEDGQKRDGASPQGDGPGGLRRAASRHAEAKLDEASDGGEADANAGVDAKMAKKDAVGIGLEGSEGPDDGCGLDDSIPRTVDRTDDDDDDDEDGDGETAPETNPYVVRAVAGEDGGPGSGRGGNPLPRCPRSPRSAVSDAPVFQLPDGTTGPTSGPRPLLPGGDNGDLDTLGSLHGISALPDRGNIVTRSDGSVVSAITLDSRVIDVDSERRTRAPKRSEKLREMQEKNRRKARQFPPPSKESAGRAGGFGRRGSGGDLSGAGGGDSGGGGPAKAPPPSQGARTRATPPPPPRGSVGGLGGSGGTSLPAMPPLPFGHLGRRSSVESAGGATVKSLRSASSGAAAPAPPPPARRASAGSRSVGSAPPPPRRAASSSGGGNGLSSQSLHGPREGEMRIKPPSSIYRRGSYESAASSAVSPGSCSDGPGGSSPRRGPLRAPPPPALPGNMTGGGGPGGGGGRTASSSRSLHSVRSAHSVRSSRSNGSARSTRSLRSVRTAPPARDRGDGGGRRRRRRRRSLSEGDDDRGLSRRDDGSVDDGDDGGDGRRRAGSAGRARSRSGPRPRSRSKSREGRRGLSMSRSVGDMSRSVGDLLFEGDGRRILKTRRGGGERDGRDGWDGNGRCPRHPSVIVAKRKPFGRGWQRLPGGCKECNGETPAGGSDDGDGGASGGRSVVSRPSSRGRKSERRKEPLTPSLSNAGGLGHVQSMPYTTPWGETGVYTGQVTGGGTPHGTGRMRFDDGSRHVGRWSRGYSEAYLREHNSGFFTYFGTRF